MIGINMSESAPPEPTPFEHEGSCYTYFVWTRRKIAQLERDLGAAKAELAKVPPPGYSQRRNSDSLAAPLPDVGYPTNYVGD